MGIPHDGLFNLILLISNRGGDIKQNLNN